VREYCFLLAGVSYQLVSIAEVGISAQIEETGTTFEENATLKAAGYATMASLITLADDSGLQVDALGGAPGVLSARYAGANASDAERLDYLLSKLKRVPWEKRTARFRCVIAIALPNGKIELCHGKCEGIITFEPKGTSGFGYDPVFYLR
jgi:XTP/dITP diphosphohydrolase